MIAKADLLKLARNKLKDAQVLFRNRRYAASVYLSGYTIELALKYSMCWLYRFKSGFPESPLEFKAYLAGSAGLLKFTIKDVRDIKIHDLNKLLYFSGEEIRIKSRFSAEWTIVSNWTHLDRYSVAIVRKQKAERFINAAHLLFNELI